MLSAVPRQRASAVRRFRSAVLDTTAAVGGDFVQVAAAEEQVVGVGAAGQADVAGLSGQAVAADGEGGMHGAALGLVQGHGVAVVELPSGRPGPVDLGLLAAGVLQRQAVPVEAGDGGGGAVEQPTAVVVAGDEDLVADAVVDRPVVGVDVQRLLAELAASQERLADVVVEQADVVAAGREQDGLPRVGLAARVEVGGDGLGVDGVLSWWVCSRPRSR